MRENQGRVVDASCTRFLCREVCALCSVRAIYMKSLKEVPSSRRKRL